jgi:hypothetical protein
MTPLRKMMLEELQRRPKLGVSDPHDSVVKGARVTIRAPHQAVRIQFAAWACFTSV